ncbi:sushi, von Willebrand factor type A, EGF and pentraxin domain-containing protein 1-like [Corticium candelabrum]|uniref:sushi, von Willebrand factor type A, EGF and pentraxin domain-containing protein 1-like n=1 Tax=Corticium candelabrum TaxID=121492 RepID=UPI002E264DAD|nr:sushi, von Willebrand factor type A, EGF and pentraxin domain-containing protein 1-like [Corticium candelabrum]
MYGNNRDIFYKASCDYSSPLMHEGSRLSQFTFVQLMSGYATHGDIKSCSPDPFSPGICPNPKSPDNGKVKLQRPVATFTCNEGYKLNGRRTMRWTVFGWSPRYSPTCTPWCPKLENPENGVVNQTALNAQYSCNRGYKLEGRSDRRCFQGHGWNLCQPVCLKKCPIPVDPENGHADVDLENDIAVYYCNDGYRAKGDSLIRCNESRQWDGPLIECVKLPPKCSKLTNPAHGLAIMGLGNYSVRYLCENPYYLHGSENRHCINGSWTVCRPFLMAPKFGEVNTDVLTATYSCSKGYYLYGQSELKCINGEWVGYRPVCVKESKYVAECTIPGPIAHGGNHLLSGDEVYYYCYLGYVMDGNRKVVCTNGKWSTFPKCYRK